MPVNCSEVRDTIILVNQIIDEIGSTRADLIPILQRISNECGHISNSAINEIRSEDKFTTKSNICSSHLLPHADDQASWSTYRTVL